MSATNLSNKEEGPVGKGFLGFLVFTALTCGTLIMVVEILGSRVIGPFFGVSLFVWSSIISVTMIALAVGYALGGILSDRKGHPDFLYGIIVVAGNLVLLIPFLKGPVISACLPLGVRAGAFVSSLLLFGPPLLLMGCVSPYIIRVAAREMHNIGRTVGSFYAISTIGSVAGTILTGFVLIVYIGVNQIFFLVGAALLGLGGVYFIFIRRKLKASFVLLLPLCFLLLPSKPNATVRLPSGTIASIVADEDGYYGNLKIVDYRYGPKHTREMLLDGIIQSGIDMRNGMSLYPTYYLLGMVPYSLNPEGKNCLVIGLGGGVIPQWFQKRGIVTDVVDIDPLVVDMAREYFQFEANGRTVIADARNFLANESKIYDFIILDVFNGEAAPAHIISVEALESLKERLSEQGVLGINFIGRLDTDALMTASVVKTLRQVFEEVDLYPYFDPHGEDKIGNITIIAHNEADKRLPADLIDRFEVHSWAKDAVGKAYQNKFKLPEEWPAIVLADNYNPIDCYDNAVREKTREAALAGTDWRILQGVK